MTQNSNVVLTIVYIYTISFTTVKPGEDPKKILKKLIAIKQRIRKRNIERDFQGAVSEENVKKLFKPVTASLAEATAKAKKEALQSVAHHPHRQSQRALCHHSRRYQIFWIQL